MEQTATRTDDGRAVIHEAVLLLSGQDPDHASTRNEIGWNRFHAGFGHDLASKPVERWTPREVYAARKMLETYKNTQLAHLWDRMPPMPASPKGASQEQKEDEYTAWRRRSEPNWTPPTPYRRLSLKSIAGRPCIAVEQNYDERLIGQIKALPQRKYDKDTKQWYVPLHLDAVEPLLDFATREGYDIAEAVTASIDDAIGVMRERVALSQSVDAQIDVPTPEGYNLFPFQRAGVAYAERVNNVMIADEMGLGKGLLNGTGVLTPSGFVPVESIGVGDSVIGSNGRPCRVTGVYPQGRVETFVVRFNDGVDVVTDGSHRWSVQHVRNGHRHADTWAVKDTQELVGRIRDGAGNATWRIPMVAPVEFETSDLPIAPYLMGVLLGDGGISTHQVRVSSVDEELLNWVRFDLPDGVSLAHLGSCDYAIRSAGPGVANPVIRALKDLGLMGTNSRTKFVPDTYLYADVHQRRALLRGLMDTDGCAGKDGTNEFFSTSKALADAVAFLAQSEGGTARRADKRLPDGSIGYRVYVKTTFNPFCIRRKADAWMPPTKYPPTRIIKDIEPLGLGETTCLAVDADDHLFVIDHCVVTHNTVQALMAIKIKDQFPAVVICPASLKRNWEREAKRWIPGIRVAVLTGSVFPLSFMGGECLYDLIIVNYNSRVLEKWVEPIKAIHPKAVILDEAHNCFPAGTIVETDAGPLPIERIVEDRMKVRALAYDSCSDVLSYKPVTGWWANANDRPMVRVTHDEGSFVCTEDHAIYVEGRGYVAAKTAARGERLRLVRSDVRVPVAGSGEQRQAPVLLESVRGAVADGATRTAGAVAGCREESVGRDEGQASAAAQRAHEAQQPDGESRDAGENATVVEGPDVPRTGRQRADDAPTGTDRVDAWMADGAFDLDQGRDRGVVADALHRGHRQPGDEVGGGNRRQDAQDGAMEVPRPAEGVRLGFARVVGVEILERGGGRRPGEGGAGDTIVYDLEVADHHNYFANGVLVHNCKNGKAQQTKLVDILLRDTGARKLFLTGTPVVNRPAEFWQLVRMLGYGPSLGGYAEFMRRYDNDDPDRLHELNQRAREHFMVRRLKRDVLPELPPKTWNVVPIEIDNRAEYDKAERNIAGYFATKKSEDAEIGRNLDHQARNMLKTTHPDLIDPVQIEVAVRTLVNQMKREVYGHTYAMAAQSEALLRWEALKQLAVKGKMKATFDWIDTFLESGEKLVVFVSHVEVGQRIAERYGADFINGKTKSDERQPMVDRFQNDPNRKVIVGNMIAMGEGLTLTAASNVCFVEWGWNPKQHSQAEDRCHRIGQRDNVTVHQLVGEATIDEELVAMINAKRDVVDAIQDGADADKQSEMFAALEARLQERLKAIR